MFPDAIRNAQLAEFYTSERRTRAWVVQNEAEKSFKSSVEKLFL